jgi:hypothetical protein
VRREPSMAFALPQRALAREEIRRERLRREPGRARRTFARRREQLRFAQGLERVTFARGRGRSPTERPACRERSTVAVTGRTLVGVPPTAHLTSGSPQAGWTHGSESSHPARRLRAAVRPMASFGEPRSPWWVRGDPIGIWTWHLLFCCYASPRVALGSVVASPRALVDR